MQYFIAPILLVSLMNPSLQWYYGVEAGPFISHTGDHFVMASDQNGHAHACV
jgi:hypothetical protein